MGQVIRIRLDIIHEFKKYRFVSNVHLKQRDLYYCFIFNGQPRPKQHNKDKYNAIMAKVAKSLLFEEANIIPRIGIMLGKYVSC